MKIYIVAFSSLIFVLFTESKANAQDIQFGDPKQVIQFYNQSIVEEFKSTLRFNFREVKVQKLTAFKSGVGMLTLPLTKQYASATSNKIFASVGAGFNQSNAKLFAQSMGLVGITIMQKITKSNTYFSLGFQGVYNQNNLNFTSVTFQDQYNIYGPLPGVSTADPLAVNANYHWLSINTGASFLQLTEQVRWFIGGSIRHINKPAVSFSKNTFFELAPTSGVQMGVAFKNLNTWLGAVAYYQTKSEASETLLGFTIEKGIGQNETTSIGGAIYYRLKDAVMPQLAIRFGKTRLSFLYELPIQTSIRSINQKTGMELSLVNHF